MSTINLAKKIKELKTGGQSANIGDKIKSLASPGTTLDKTERVLLALFIFGISSYYWIPFGIDTYLKQPLMQEVQARSADLDTQLASVTQKLKEFDAIKEEIVAYEKNMAELREKLDIIDRVQKGRNSIVRMVDFIVKELPPSVWLTKLSIENNKDKKVNISGSALSMQLVSEFIKGLEGAVFFPSWELKSADNDTSQTQTVATPGRAPVSRSDAKKFELSAAVVAL